MICELNSHLELTRHTSDNLFLLLAHNAKCDVVTLRHSLAMVDSKLPVDWLFVDTLPLVKQLAVKGDEVNLASKYLDSPHHHRASSDVMDLARILVRLLQIRRSEEELDPA